VTIFVVATSSTGGGGAFGVLAHVAANTNAASVVAVMAILRRIMGGLLPQLSGTDIGREAHVAIHETIEP